MTEENNQPVSHPLGIGPLVELFYSLAIVSGLEYIFGLFFDPSAKGIELMICASVGALFLSLGDWAVFHLFVSPHKYKSIIRVVFDLLIVIVIFITFRTINNPFIFSIAITLYFTFGVIYHFLLLKEHLLVETADRITILQGTLALFSVVLTVGHLLDSRISDLLLIGSSILGAVWGIANLFLANKVLQSQ